MSKVYNALNAITGALLGTSLGMIVFIPAAFAERGYCGFGGEWILIALCGAIGLYVGIGRLANEN